MGRGNSARLLIPETCAYPVSAGIRDEKQLDKSRATFGSFTRTGLSPKSHTPASGEAQRRAADDDRDQTQRVAYPSLFAAAA